MRANDEVTFQSSPTGYANSFLLSPIFTNPATQRPFSATGAVGPAYLVDTTGIVQQPGADGICLVLFDATTLPADGRAMFTGDPNDPQPKRIWPLTGGNLCPPIYTPIECYHGIALVTSKSYSTLTYSTGATFFSFTYAQSRIGAPR